eukprot:2955566-Amphidinium_carterae.1
MDEQGQPVEVFVDMDFYVVGDNIGDTCCVRHDQPWLKEAGDRHGRFLNGATATNLKPNTSQAARQGSTMGCNLRLPTGMQWN